MRGILIAAVAFILSGQEEAIRWETSFKETLRKSAESEKPVLWVHAFGSFRPKGGG